MDVTNAFLHGNFKEKIYIELPQRVKRYGFENLVCKLKKSLYELCQLHREWYSKLSSKLIKEGFKISSADHSLFVKSTTKGIVVLTVYVDGIVITGDSKYDIEETKDILKRNFNMKDLGRLKYCIGLEITQSKKGIVVH